MQFLVYCSANVKVNNFSELTAEDWLQRVYQAEGVQQAAALSIACYRLSAG